MNRLSYCVALFVPGLALCTSASAQWDFEGEPSLVEVTGPGAALIFSEEDSLQGILERAAEEPREPYVEAARLRRDALDWPTIGKDTFAFMRELAGK